MTFTLSLIVFGTLLVCVPIGYGLGRIIGRLCLYRAESDGRYR